MPETSATTTGPSCARAARPCKRKVRRLLWTYCHHNSHASRCQACGARWASDAHLPSRWPETYTGPHKYRRDGERLVHATKCVGSKLSLCRVQPGRSQPGVRRGQLTASGRTTLRHLGTIGPRTDAACCALLRVQATCCARGWASVQTKRGNVPSCQDRRCRTRATVIPTRSAVRSVRAWLLALACRLQLLVPALARSSAAAVRQRAATGSADDTSHVTVEPK
jgi:hypothetical protein